MTQTANSKLSRTAIKYLAIITMTINHIAHTLLSSKTVIYWVFMYIGYFTAITMCFFLVEGYHTTSSKAKYIIRMALFALISQIPYYFAFRHGNLNMMFTLLICLLILALLNSSFNPVLKWVGVVLLVALTWFSDWALIIAISAVLFECLRGSKSKQAIAYGLAILVNFSITFLEWRYRNVAFDKSLLHCVFASLAFIVSAIAILFFYEPTKNNAQTKFNKYFFYGYYPLHLLILGVLRLM